MPVHPGPPPEPVGTAAIIGVALRNYAEALADVALYNALSAALAAQILSAVNSSFLSAVEDPNFGFDDVTPRAMLEHLRTEYGTLTPEELEKNRAALSEPWNFDDPIEDLWAKIVNIQRVAAFGLVPIPDITIITLTLAMIEKTGLLASTTEKFRLRPVTEWTVATFKADFIMGNKERIRRLTAGDAGFHGAHSATLPARHPQSGNRSGCRHSYHSSYTSTPCRGSPRHCRRGQDVLLLDTRSQPTSQSHFPHLLEQGVRTQGQCHGVPHARRLQHNLLRPPSPAQHVVIQRHQLTAWGAYITDPRSHCHSA